MRFQSPIRTFEVEIEEGKLETFRLALNYQALVTLCDIWKIELANLDKALNSIDVKKIPDVIFAAMSGLTPDVTRAQSDRFCNALTVPDLTTCVMELITASSPPPKEGNAGAGPQKPPEASA